MGNELKKAAGILVECGYAENSAASGRCVLVEEGIEKVAPFADTLEGRRQADAIEDWLLRQESDIYRSSATLTGLYSGNTLYQHRLYRIKWCLEQLSGEDNE